MNKFFFIIPILLLTYALKAQCPETVTNSANGCLYMVWATPPNPLPTITGFTYNSGAGTSASPAEYRPGGGCGSNQGGYSGTFAISGGPSCTYINGAFQGDPMPIILMNFLAIKYNHYNLISWTTASEINNDVHVVERSKNGTSGWEILGEVKGTNLNEEMTYEIKDENPNSLTYYRLYSLDYDGNKQFSTVVMVRQKDQGLGHVFNIYPNPATHIIEVDLEAEVEGFITFTILDMTGKSIKTLNNNFNKGISTQKIDVQDIPPGIYFLAINGSGIHYHTIISKI